MREWIKQHGRLAWATVAGVLSLVTGLAVHVHVNVTVNVTPEPARFGWAGPHVVREAAPIIAAMPPFAIDGVQRDNARANVRLWQFARAVRGGSDLPTFRQEIGDCVSMGAANAVNYLACTQIARDRQNSEFHPAFQPYIYGVSRHQVGHDRLGHTEGSVGAWAAEAVRQFGVLAADAPGVPGYSGAVASQWGAAGPPEPFVEQARQFRVVTVAPVKSADDVRDAVCNGYPVTIASNWGGLMRPPVVDGRLVNRRAERWNHQMCVIGYDGQTGREPYWYVLNSWGPGAHGAPPDDAVPGGFWLRRGDIDDIVRQGDSFAYSGFEGFPARELDFRVLGLAPMTRRFQPAKTLARKVR